MVVIDVADSIWIYITGTILFFWFFMLTANINVEHWYFSQFLMWFQVMLHADMMFTCFLSARGIIYVIDSSAFHKEVKDVAE